MRLRRWFLLLLALTLIAPTTSLASSAKATLKRVTRITRTLTHNDRPSPTGVMRIGAASDDQPAGTAPRRAAVAILDTGIARIPELNVVGGHDCSGSGNFSDANGHGTHVAGIVGARWAPGRINRVVGVSPGTPLYSVRVFDEGGSGDLANVVCGLNWVAANAAALNIRVVNMSLGEAGTDDSRCPDTKNSLHAAVCKVIAKGVTVVAAASNESESLAKSVPGTFDEILTVTAMADFDGQPGGKGTADCSDNNHDDSAADFSDYAVPGSADAGHTIAAPGVCITSTWMDGTTETMSGTSMASPHVAGLIARCIDAGPCASLSPAQITAKLLADAAARPADTGFAGDPQHPISGKYYGNLAWARGY